MHLYAPLGIRQNLTSFAGRFAAGLLGLALLACGEGPADLTSGFAGPGIYYEASGSGDPLVLLHGFSLDRRMWAPQMEALEAHFRVIRYDLRGHGQSLAIADSFSAHEDLSMVLDAAGVERAALVGLSAGSQIAVDFTLTHPGRVRALVLAGPGLSGYVPRDTYDWVEPVYEAAGAGDFARAARLWSRTDLMVIPEHPPGDSLMRRIVEDNAKVWSYSTNPERVLSPPAIERMGELSIPLLVIVGDRDLPDVHAVADTLVAIAPDARKRVIEGAGHMVNLARPDVFNEIVVRFLGAPEG